MSVKIRRMKRARQERNQMIWWFVQDTIGVLCLMTMIVGMFFAPLLFV